jgi:hypothetical protein
MGLIESAAYDREWPDEVKENWEERADRIVRTLQNETQEIVMFAESFDHPIEEEDDEAE